MRKDSERLRDILDAIERIERYAARGREAFDNDELIRTWVVYHLQIIGEAAARFDEAFREAHSDIPWVDIVAMRNVLVHEYFGIDPEEVWSVVQTDMQALKLAIRALLDAVTSD